MGMLLLQTRKDSDDNFPLCVEAEKGCWLSFLPPPCLVQAVSWGCYLLAQPAKLVMYTSSRENFMQMDDTHFYDGHMTISFVSVSLSLSLCLSLFLPLSLSFTHTPTCTYPPHILHKHTHTHTCTHTHTHTLTHTHTHTHSHSQRKAASTRIPVKVR